MTPGHSVIALAQFQAPCVAAVSAGAALTVLARRFGRRFQWCGVPLTHHTHSHPVPRIGGLAVYSAVVMACLIAGFVIRIHSLAAVLPILWAALPVLAVGAYDDLWHVFPRTKIFAQLIGVGILLAANWKVGVHATVAQGVLLTLWIVLTTNSFNLIDGVDGLASGTVIVIGLCLAALNFVLGNPPLCALSLILVAACLGFLPFNLRGPKVFLGDCGSLSLGFILAAIAFETPHESTLPWRAFALFGYPLAETLFTVFRRAIKGRKLSQPDREHFHHKLRNSGLTTFQTSALLCLMALAFACIGIMLNFGCSLWFITGCDGVLLLAIAQTFGYLRWRNVAKLKRVLRRQFEQEMPPITGYLLYK